MEGGRKSEVMRIETTYFVYLNISQDITQAQVHH